MKCSTCGMELSSVWAGDPDVEKSLQYDNVLVLQTHSGYAMFTDNFEDPDPVFVLCHECAHLFCRIFDPECSLINPATSHSHKPGTVAAEHVGWDMEDKNDA